MIPHPTDHADPIVVGSIAGCGTLIAALVLAAAWFICKKKRPPLFLDPDQMQFTHDYLSDRNIHISQSTPDLIEVNQTPPETASDKSPSKRGIFQISSRQWTLPTVPQRHQTFQRMLSHRLDLSNIEFSVQSIKHKEQPELGAIKPELYKQASVDSLRSEHTPCGKLFFSLKYVQEQGSLFVSINRAENLPAKDFSGTSDPYVKVYLLPDRKTKHQTKVHRKTLTPEFNETFVFSVNYENIPSRTLYFNLYDFDRFSRHDLIGAVVVKDIFSEGSLVKETFFVRDIYVTQQEKADIGEVMLSLCYLPTAGRLTLTVVKARNLKAMDITGSSDPYVKVSLMCQGKRIKKKKTSVQKNTLHPVFNEALVFDVPQESVEDVYLIVKVVDYDRIGSDELMGSVALGPKYNGLGRDHWYEMLENPRKPVAQWYPLQEHLPAPSNMTPNGKCCLRQRQSTEDSNDGSSVM
ncbi:synaptotagmin-9-like isoform X1 [Haliotis rubra]|uniref:synaptotagmin-9-like isoform X1 n=2 Tax=Haliotis rubra TaxID=36100 RepID=UPI001EE5E674|nr:synaptotagmin-9-like isoform X1 [Haliotis rubra]